MIMAMTRKKILMLFSMEKKEIDRHPADPNGQG
jgi:hypothetical protein